MPIRILLVDDCASIRIGLRMRLTLEPDFSVVGEAVDGLQALSLALTLQPEVIVMDVELPRLDGLIMTKVLKHIAPHSRVVLLTIHDNARLRAQACAIGAVAFVAKQAGDAPLLAAIRQASPASG